MEHAQLLISKNVAPIKREYLVFRESNKAVANGEADAANSSPAAPAAAAAAAVTTGGVAAQRKSKNQLKRERNEQKAQRICINNLMSSCAFGDSCRYSHDTGSYMASKPPDLPGSCPFIAQGAVELCPYGITCRWATKHTDASGEKARSAAAVAAAAAADPSQEEQQQPAGGAAPDGGSAPQPDPGAAASERHSAALSAVALAAGTSCSNLPALRNVVKPVNALEKDVVHKLWKGKYNFSRADATLASLGIAPGANRPRKSKHEQGDKQEMQQKQKQQQQAQRQEQQPAAVGQEAAQQPEAANEQPAQKRQRVEVRHGSDISLEGLYAAAAGGAPAAADMDASPPATSRAASGGGTNHPAAAEAAAAAGANATSSAADADNSTHPPVILTAANAAAAVTAEAATAAEAEAEAAMTAAAAAAERQSGYVEGRLPAREKPKLDLKGKTYLAPLTTVGNLPFRRLCKDLGCEVTCGEMALTTNLLQGQASEWALLKRHPSEDIFGIQVCGGYPDAMSRLCQLASEHISCDFVDLNCGCPIDIICARQAGSALLTKPRRFEEVVRSASAMLDVPLIVKMRKGYNDGADVAHELIPQVAQWGASAITLHGRTRQQRYSRQADWEYIERCADVAAQVGLPLVGNGDVMSYDDWAAHMAGGHVTTCMIGRGALIKPWIFTEIREQRLWDISAGERFDQLKQFCSYGLEHWGSDGKGVETTRRFLLEWLSLSHRYVPVGLLEVAPQQMHWRPPTFRGRNDLETLLGSDSAADWVRVSEMMLGPAPPGFTFSPKHKSNAYTLSALDARLLAQGVQPAISARAAGDDEDEGEENG